MDFHRFHVMRCDNDVPKCVRYPCIGSPNQPKRSALKKPYCRRCGRPEPGCDRPEPSCSRPEPFCGRPEPFCGRPEPFCGRKPLQPCKSNVKHIVCEGKQKKLKNKNINTDCILIPQIPICKRRKKKRTRIKTSELLSPCSILSLQNKCVLANADLSQHRHCRKYYPRLPRMSCDDKDRNSCHRPKRDCYRPKPQSCSPCGKTIATNTSAILEPKCVQIRKKMNEIHEGNCNLVPTCDFNGIAPCNNDATLKRTTVSKSCMCEPGCCNELVCNSNSAPCQRPLYCDNPCKNDGVAPCDIPKCYNDPSCIVDAVPPCDRPKCINDPPWKVVDVNTRFRPKCFEDPPCKAGEVAPYYRPKCFNGPSCINEVTPYYRPKYLEDPCKTNEVAPFCRPNMPCKDEVAPCYRPKYYNGSPCKDDVPPCYRQICYDSPCKHDKIYPCRLPKCITDIPCKHNKVPPCHDLKCNDGSPCRIDEYAPCHRPPKKRNKRTNTKAISRCWKLKKLPKIRRCIKTKCIKRQLCCAGAKIKTCKRHNSKTSVCDCLKNLRKRSITYCASGKHTQVSTAFDTCRSNPCRMPNMFTKMSCDSDSQICPPKRLNCSKRDCGIDPCDSIMECYLHRKEKAMKQIEARRMRQKYCRCILTCTFAVFCAPCFLVALSYWLIKYACSSCNENNNCNVGYPCEMPQRDKCYFVTGSDKNCHGKYCIDEFDKSCNVKCPILDDESLIVNGCEQKSFKKVSFGQPCSYDYDICNKPCFDGSIERCIQTSRCCMKNSHPFPERQYNLYYVDNGGWVIKPISGGGDCITEAFPCKPPGPGCARQRTLREVFRKAKCVCLKALPCSMVNMLECSYKKARCGSVNYFEPSNVVCPKKIKRCQCGCNFYSRACNMVKRAYRCMDVIGCPGCHCIHPIKPTFKRTFRQLLNSFCSFLRYIICTCCCCPLFFCLYCCEECCRRTSCCMFC